MVENKSSLFGIIAIIIGASGLGIGAYSIVNFQTVEGPQGIPGDDGQDGTDGQDAPGDFIVRILDPDYEEVVSGNITVRALVYGSTNFNITVLRNGTEIGTTIPLEWDTSSVSDGWWNLSIIATDIVSKSQSQDKLLIYTLNNPLYFYNSSSNIVQTLPHLTWGELHWINFSLDFRANVFVYFNGRLSLSPAGFVHLGFRLDDANFIIIELTPLGSSSTNINHNIIYSQVPPGPHQVSFYWESATGTETITCETYSIIGVVITI